MTASSWKSDDAVKTEAASAGELLLPPCSLPVVHTAPMLSLKSSCVDKSCPRRCARTLSTRGHGDDEVAASGAHMQGRGRTAGSSTPPTGGSLQTGRERHGGRTREWASE